MDIYSTLLDLEERIYELKMKKTKSGFITVDEIQERMRNKEPMPTAFFHTTKTDYIVKARTIYGPKTQKRKSLIKLPPWRKNDK